MSPSPRLQAALAHQICHQWVGRARVSIDTLLCFGNIAGFVSQMPLLNMPLVFHPKFGDIPLELDR